MKNIKKFTAAVLAAAMLTLFAGCGGDQSWSFKTDTVSLTAGTYIYNLLNCYYEAYDLVESPDEAKNILDETVTDSDNNTTTVEQYSYDNAETETIKMLAVEQLMSDLGLELDRSEYDAALSYTSQIWGNIKDQFEAYGISQESFNYCYAEYTVKYGQVFEALYGEGGDKYVSDEELTEYFKDNYVGYAYFGRSMATTDDEGNSVAKSDEEFEKTENDFNSYVDAVNSGEKTYKEVVAEYVEEYELTSDPTYSGSVKPDDNTLDESIAKTLNSLNEGEAAVVKTGKDATAYYYFVYKPTADSIVDFLETDSDSDTDTDTEDSTEETTATTETTETTETTDTAATSVYIYDLKSGYSHYTLLNDMKGDDYDDYLTEFSNSLNYSKNDDVVGKFKPSMFVG